MSIVTIRPIPLAAARAAKLSSLAERRWLAEEGGTTLFGNPLASDRVTQAKVTAAYVMATADAEYSIPDWKFGPGAFGALDSTTIIAAGGAIEAHVQACFTRERVLSAAILAADNLEELDSIDIENGWPG